MIRINNYNCNFGGIDLDTGYDPLYVSDAEIEMLESENTDSSNIAPYFPDDEPLPFN